MIRVNRLRTAFTAEIPEFLEDGTLYVSQECCIAMHNCACGCGNEVATPLVPTEYILTMHGEEASIRPSIGNHDYACTSHYIIDRGNIVWSGKMSRTAIEEGREADRLLKRPPAPVQKSRAEAKSSNIRDLLNWIKATFYKIFG